MILASGDGLFSVGRPVGESRNSVWTRSKRHYPSPTRNFGNNPWPLEVRKCAGYLW